MTGQQIHSIRDSLSLDRPRFAQLVGADKSTVSRWESHDDKAPRVDPFQMQVLAIIREQVHAASDGGRMLGDRILNGLLVGGPMLGLYRLLEDKFGNKRTT